MADEPNESFNERLRAQAQRARDRREAAHARLLDTAEDEDRTQTAPDDGAEEEN